MLQKALVMGAATTAFLFLWALRRSRGKGSIFQPPKLEQKGPEGRRVTNFTLEITQGRPKLFNNRICPFGNRAWWAALEKKMDFEYIHVDLGDDKPPSFSVINPYETVPCYYENGRGIFESNNAAAFFEESFPNQGTQLLPSDPFVRASVREVIAKFEVGYLYQHLRLQDLSKREETIQKTLQELEWFAGLYAKQHPTGPYFLGDQLSLVDIAVLPFLERFCILLQYYRNYELLPVSNPKLTRLRLALEAARLRPAWRMCAQSPEFFVRSYANYGRKTDTELQAEAGPKPSGLFFRFVMYLMPRHLKHH
jgi:glutathione S-transferase